MKFIGYDDKSTAYLLLEFSTKKIIKARNVLFKEEEIQSFYTIEEPNPEESIFESPDLDNECSNQTKEKTVEDEVGEIESEVSNQQNQSEDEENNDEVEPQLARETRNRRPPERYGNPYTFNTTQEETRTEPKTYKEAVILQKLRIGNKQCNQNSKH